MNASSQVRIVIDRNGTRFYIGGFIDDPNNRGKHLPELIPVERVRQSWLGSRDRAVQLVKVLREQSWDAHILDPSTGSLLYEEAVARFDPAPTPKDERAAMFVGNILIVPGNPRGYFIRFPGQNLESIFGNTADEAYQKLIEHPQANTLIPLAERYIAPDIQPIDPQGVARQEQFARHGRLRPGSL